MRAILLGWVFLAAVTSAQVVPPAPSAPPAVAAPLNPHHGLSPVADTVKPDPEPDNVHPNTDVEPVED